MNNAVALRALLETFLDKRDPVRKSARAQARREKLERTEEMDDDADSRLAVMTEQKTDQTVSFELRGGSKICSELSPLDIKNLSIPRRIEDIVHLSNESNPQEAVRSNTPSATDPQGVDEKRIPQAIPQGIRYGKRFERERIPAETRHAIFYRDENRCTYVYQNTEERCDETRFLQIDHIVMVCRGGTNDPANLRIRCAGHNKMTA